MTKLTLGLGVLAAIVAAACSSSSTGNTPAGDGGTGGSNVCGMSSNPKATEITKAASSGPTCPDITLAQINADDPDSSTTCKPVIDSTACTLKVDCTEDGARTTGTFTATNGVATGSLTVVIGDVTCTYAVTFK